MSAVDPEPDVELWFVDTTPTPAGHDPRVAVGALPDAGSSRTETDVAFGVDDRATLDELVGRLRAEGVETEGIETDPVLNKEYVAFRDPDNVQWEFYMR